MVTSLQEPIYSQLDALTGEHFLISMAVEREQKEKGTISDAKANKEVAPPLHLKDKVENVIDITLN